jgi:hypothetical protein
MSRSVWLPFSMVSERQQGSGESDVYAQFCANNSRDRECHAGCSADPDPVSWCSSAQRPESRFRVHRSSGFGLSLRFRLLPCGRQIGKRRYLRDHGRGHIQRANQVGKCRRHFTYKTPNGTVIETGIWTSNQLISFDSYGAAPNALRQRGIVAGVPGFRPNPSPMSSSPVPIGGLAVFRIRLLPASGMPMRAVLQVNCALADAPRDRSRTGSASNWKRVPPSSPKNWADA